MRYLTIEEVINFAASTIEGVKRRDKVVFRQWAYAAMRDLGVGKLDEKTAEISVDDFSIKKPCDLVHTIGLSVYNNDNVELYYTYKGWGQEVLRRDKRAYTRERDLVSSRRIVSNRVGSRSIASFIVTEDKDYYNLSSDARSADYGIVKYFGLPIDEDGDLMFIDDDLLAVSAFIRWMYETRQRENQSAIADRRQDWIIEAGKARAKKKSVSIFEAKDIAKHYMSMIDKFIDNID